MQEVASCPIWTRPSLHNIITHTICNFAVRFADKLLIRIAIASGVGTLLRPLCFIDLFPLVVVGLPFGLRQSR